MPSWWRKSSKEAKTDAAKERFIDLFHKKFRSPESKSYTRSSGSRRRSSDTVSERGSHSRAQSRSPSPSKHVSRSQSFAETPQGLPIPQTGQRQNSGISESAKPKVEKSSKPSLFLPLTRPSCIRQRLEPGDIHAEPAVPSISSESSVEGDDPADSRQRSPLATDCDIGSSTAVDSPSIDHPISAPVIKKESRIPAKLSSVKKVSSSPSRRRMLNGQVPILQVPNRGAFFSAPDSSMSSPSRSPIRGCNNEQAASNNFSSRKHHTDFPFLSSGHCSSPGSGQTSGHNSMGGDMYGQLLWQPSRGSPEYSPNPSPRLTSPGPSSRIHSGAVTPIHPRSVGHSDSPGNWPDDARQPSHRLPLPPIAITSPFSHQNSAVTSPSVPRSPGRPENIVNQGSRWKKGKLLGRGTFGHVYVGFNSETGEMCAMKEVTLFADDAKSKESAKQLGQEIALLSRLRHPNIVQYIGSEMVGDRLYIYLEYVSGGSIHKILQEYGKLGESAIRSYTQQILSGLAYLHAKNTVHRDIKGANILVDPNGRIKLADFGMAKHIAGQSCPLSFKGSPYWMAPEVIRNLNGCSLAVDIWSLGCTVLEMATAKPPWSQYEGVAAMFKIGNSKELPAIPDNLSDEGKDFVRLCLQRNPQNRPTAAKLLDHPFVKGASSPWEKHVISSASSDHPALLNVVKSMGIQSGRVQSESERLAVHSSRVPKSNFQLSFSDSSLMPRNISCPVSPVGSPLLHSRSPQHLSGRMSPSPISSPRTPSGSSTPLTGGIGAIPFRNQLTLSPEGGITNLQMRPLSPSYWDPDILRGLHYGSNAPRQLSPHDNDVLVKQHGRIRTGERYDAQSALSDRISQQLQDPAKLNLSPTFPSTYNRTSGL